MILHNVTINIDQSVEREWLTWMRQEHVPAVMATGLPVSSKILRLLTELNNGGTTYTFQYFFKTMEDYESFDTLYANVFQEKHHARYQNKYVDFRTLLEEI